MDLKAMCQSPSTSLGGGGVSNETRDEIFKQLGNGGVGGVLVCWYRGLEIYIEFYKLIES